MSKKKIDNTPDLYTFLLEEYRLTNYYGQDKAGIKKMHNKTQAAWRLRKEIKELDVDNDTLLKVLEACSEYASSNQPFDQLVILESSTGFKEYRFEPKNLPNEEFINLLKGFKKQIKRLRVAGVIPS